MGAGGMAAGTADTTGTGEGSGRVWYPKFGSRVAAGAGGTGAGAVSLAGCGAAGWVAGAGDHARRGSSTGSGSATRPRCSAATMTEASPPAAAISCSTVAGSSMPVTGSPAGVLVGCGPGPTDTQAAAWLVSTSANWSQHPGPTHTGNANGVAAKTATTLVGSVITSKPAAASTSAAGGQPTTASGIEFPVTPGSMPQGMSWRASSVGAGLEYGDARTRSI